MGFDDCDDGESFDESQLDRDPDEPIGCCDECECPLFAGDSYWAVDDGPVFCQECYDALAAEDVSEQ